MYVAKGKTMLTRRILLKTAAASAPEFPCMRPLV